MLDWHKQPVLPARHSTAHEKARHVRRVVLFRRQLELDDIQADVRALVD